MTVEAPEVVIPFHMKDAPILPWCIEGLRKHLRIGAIHLMAGDDAKDLAGKLGLNFVHEDTVVPGCTARSFTSRGWGWYFQQILKLGAPEIVRTSHYLVVDSDAVFLRKVSLFNDAGQPLYAIGREYHAPYFAVFKEMLGFPANREYSFVVHHMVFDRQRVIEMREQFMPDSPWHLNISRYRLPCPPGNSVQQFSEYETYGHWLKARHSEELRLRPLRWTNIAQPPTPALLRRLGRRYDYCAFHFAVRNRSSGLLGKIGERLRLEARILAARDNEDATAEWLRDRKPVFRRGVVAGDGADH